MFSRLLFKLARSGVGRGLVGWGLSHMAFALPVEKLRQTPTLLAFHHPKPAYPLHILLVPRTAIASLTALSPDNTAFLTDLLTTVQSLVAEFDLERHGYRLICNGGPNQDIPQLHFHLIAERFDPTSPSPAPPKSHQ